jgi:hypothetical protein
MYDFEWETIVGRLLYAVEDSGDAERRGKVR